ncbi:MAG: serine/threonine protein kinase [Victivallales bacterium]|nr:serine/threonine protein kinase [Victivallales bacterium]
MAGMKHDRRGVVPRKSRGQGDFDSLTPDVVIDSVEQTLETPMTALTIALPSYINRVYELQALSGERVIAKFYRPGRWSREALLEEHRFMADCAHEEIPLAMPIKLSGGRTLAETAGGVFFAIFNKRMGREFEIRGDDDWRRLGGMAARIHLAGQGAEAPARLRLHPETATRTELDKLLGRGFIPPPCDREFGNICQKILSHISGMFDDTEYIRVHGDCHRGNIIDRLDEGLMIIDFDDMMTAPPVQDLWLLLPGHAAECKKQTKLLVQGYEMFRRFDHYSLRLIEPLRAMRIIYFLSWCGMQKGDLKFDANFPEWGSVSFWRRETRDLATQLEVIRRGR